MKIVFSHLGLGKWPSINLLIYQLLEAEYHRQDFKKDYLIVHCLIPLSLIKKTSTLKQ